MSTVRVWQVRQVVGAIQQTLESDPHLANLWIEGEVTNYSRSPAGHQYFALKDGDTILNAVLFFRQYRHWDLKDGDRIIAHGRVSYYPQRGQLQLMVDVVQPQGVGEFHLRFEALRARLEDEGLFDPGRKRALPRFPRRIGLVTSPAGAVLHDITTVLGRRYPLGELVVVPAAVQGAAAIPDVLRGLALLNSQPDIDVIIVARGGGSIEELWAFNEEPVARAIFGSRVPVISAIGHETDVTIADFVADVRAPTPSAAAEIVAPGQDALRHRITTHHHLLTGSVRRRLTENRHRVALAGRSLDRHLPDFRILRQRIDDLTRHGQRTIVHRTALQREQVATLNACLENLNPLATLTRGYAVVTNDRTGQVIRSGAEGSRASDITVSTAHGAFGATVRQNQRRNGRAARPSILQGSLDGFANHKEVPS